MEPVAATKATIVAATAANKIVEQSIDPGIAEKAATVAATVAEVKAAHANEAHDRMVAGQRQVNVIWEYTQATIALLVTVSNIGAASYVILKAQGADVQMAMLMLSGSFNLIIGFYFARTNHTAIGGIGEKPSPKYEGR